MYVYEVFDDDDDDDDDDVCLSRKTNLFRAATVWTQIAIICWANVYKWRSPDVILLIGPT